MKRLLKYFFRLLLKVVLVLFILSLVWVTSYKFINPPISGMMLYNWITEENYRYNYEWKNLNEIDSSIPLAFIAAEDQKFLEHNGFDVEAIEKAIKHNKESERKRGASTISQQVAKNVFLYPTKNFFRKGVEAYFTGLIELIWGKKRIMEVYCNVVELGEGTYGVESASLKVFKKPALSMSRNEAALVATVLPNPIKFNLSKPSNYMLQRQSWILRQMSNLGGEQILAEWYE